MVTKEAFSIQEFCDAHDLSRATFYRLAKEGQAPSTMKIGKRTLVSREAAAAWRRAMEQNQRQRGPQTA